MVSDYLSVGEANAVPGRHLADTLGLSVRELTRQIERERKHGAPICASTGYPRGYYLTEDPEELRRYCISLDSRLRNMMNTRRAIGDTLAQMTGQDTIGGW